MAPSKVLAQDVAYWKRLEDGSDQKSYEYLINSTQRHLDRKQMEKNSSGRRAALQAGRLLTPSLSTASGAAGSGGKPPCWHFHVKGSCRFGDRCLNSHAPVTAEVKKNFKLPSRSGTPSSAERAEKTGKGKGDGTASSANPPRVYCRFFIHGERKHGA